MEVFIHPTAIVNSKAKLEDGVEVGPYSMIGENVHIGRGTKIGPQVLVEGWVSIGRDCIISQGVSIGGLPQDRHYKECKSFIKIGDRNLIREYATIHRATGEGNATQIGNDNFLMAYSHIAHNCVLEDGIVLANFVGLAGYVTVEKRAIIGGLTGVHQYVRIGAYSIIGGCSKVVKDIPPYMKADGHPATLWGLNSVGLRRANFPPKTRTLLKKAYKILFKSNLNTTEALKKIEEEINPIPEIKHLCEFIRNSERGISKEKIIPK
ncbi:acyl-ACP--UDP-N-acetylglucosamine O-acyltransferase [Candidatus Aerophobetes bacterium]|nr:acyl-ACP--UDP-N-acetylglucosamine O-acyltransferase [Candidatus Aerophobetes bacterium]